MNEVDLTDLPHSEAIVIAEIARTSGAFLDDIEVTVDDFQVNEAAWAFETMKRLYAEGQPFDWVAVGTVDARVMQYMGKVSDEPGWAAAFHAARLHEAGIRRRLDQAALWTHANVGAMELGSLIDGARAKIDEAAGLRRAPLTYFGDIVDQVIADAERPRITYQSPWEGLDEILGGFRPGALYILAARPGIGKTAIALQIAAELAMAGPVAMSSLEMPKEELVRRIIAQNVEMPHALLESGRPLPAYWKEKIDAWLHQAPHALAIDDRATVTISDIRAFARSVKRPSDSIAGVVVDYLQLMSGPAGASRYEIVTENARQFKLMARELQCPVIVLSQLNRDSEKRMDKRPSLSDLRDSGAIEQDADVVMMLYKDMDNMPMAPSDIPLPVPLELNVAKNRHGPTHMMTLMWEGSQMRAHDGRDKRWQ